MIVVADTSPLNYLVLIDEVDFKSAASASSSTLDHHPTICVKFHT